MAAEALEVAVLRKYYARTKTPTISEAAVHSSLTVSVARPLMRAIIARE
jgi:hypothetical protein